MKQTETTVHEAERVVLGAVLVEPTHMDDITAVLHDHDFIDMRHQVIFSNLLTLQECGTPLDVLTLADRLEKGGSLFDVGGYEYLNELTIGIPRVANVAYYSEIVVEASKRRRLAHVTGQIKELFHDPELSSKGIAVHAQNLLLDFDDKDGTDGFRATGDLIDDVLSLAEEKQNNPEAVRGIPTGLVDLDKKTGGFQKEQLVVIAARPGMGKSCLAMNIARTASVGGAVGAFFALEMSDMELMNRLLAQQANVPFESINRGNLTSDQWSFVHDASDVIRKMPLHFDVRAATTVPQIRAQARRLKRRFGLDYVVIDYIQLLRNEGRRTRENKTQEVSEITRDLKIMAKELKVPVFALSQLNRKCEERTDKRPLLADLRDSGSIEQDADIVCFIYRDSYYRNKRELEFADESAVTELIIAKHRNGPTCTVKAHFQAKAMRFDGFGRF